MNTVTATVAPSRQARALSVLAAVAVAVAVWVVAVPLAGADLTVTQFDRASEVGVLMVIANALVASLAGWALLALLERRLGARAGRIWTAIAGVVLVLSLIPSLTVDASTSTRLTLAAMHLAVGAVLIAGLRRTVRR
jgi:drug/metabolite transporter superfamily protein YnfA